MGNISPMLIVILLPLIAGFVLLFLPKQLRVLSKAAALIISAIALYLAIVIFRTKPEEYSFSILNLSSFDINLTLTAMTLSTLVLLASCGFGFLITLYSLKSISPDTKRVNEYFGAILLTIGGSAGILLTEHLLVLLICWEIVTASLYLMIM